MKTNSVNISPNFPNLSFSKPTVLNLLSPPPSPKFHPYVVEACRLMYGKLPDQLNSEESENFRRYRQWKEDSGEPIEEDVIYKPISSY